MIEKAEKLPERILTEDEKFYFYTVMKNTVEKNLRRGSRLMVNDFFGRFVDGYQLFCGKDVLGISSYTQIYPSLGEFAEFRGTGIQSYIVFTETDKYEEKIRRHKAIADSILKNAALYSAHFVYAEISEVKKDEMTCTVAGPSPQTVSIPKAWPAVFSCTSVKGDYIWLLCGKDRDREYHIPCGVHQSTFVSELRMFGAYYKKNDTIYLPVSSVSRSSVFMYIGPNAYVMIPMKNIPPGKAGRISAGSICEMKVGDIITNPENGKIRIFLSFSKLTGLKGASTAAGNGANRPDIGFIPVHDNVVMHIEEDVRICEALDRHLGGHVNRENLRALVTDAYRKSYRDGGLIVKQKNGGTGISVPLNIRDAGGVYIDAFVNRNPGRDSFFLAAVASATPEDTLRRFTGSQDWLSDLSSLFEIMLDENWAFGKYTRGYVVANYIRINFYKSYIDDTIFRENGYAVFNTGLVDTEYRDIYGVFKCRPGFTGTEYGAWDFLFFAARGNMKNGKRLNSLFSRFPDPPEYVKPGCGDQMFLDTGKEMLVDYDHIIMDNIERIPAGFMIEKFPGEHKVSRRLGAGERIRDIRKDITGDPGLMGILCSSLDYAFTSSLKKIRHRRFDIAVPIYYPRINGISLLVPLWLTQEDILTGKASAAFVASLSPSGSSYQIQTIFTPDMCRLDIKQFIRADIGWL